MADIKKRIRELHARASAEDLRVGTRERLSDRRRREWLEADELATHPARRQRILPHLGASSRPGER